MPKGPTLVAGALAAVSVAWCQNAGINAPDAVVDLLVFGTDQPIDAAAYPPEVRSELERYRQRYTNYRPEPFRPALKGLSAGEAGMVYAARVRYERKLAAVSQSPSAPALARAYVERLRPCYEWEGFHDCPEREARFAAAYRAANPGGPFDGYLPLLEAHLWLCTAEAYEYEKQPAGVERSRRAFEEAISQAKRSASALIRYAAEGLSRRSTCFSKL